MQILQLYAHKAVSFLCRSLVKLRQYNKSYGSGSVSFVNNVNSKFWLKLQSELIEAMNIHD